MTGAVFRFLHDVDVLLNSSWQIVMLLKDGKEKNGETPIKIEVTDLLSFQLGYLWVLQNKTLRNSFADYPLAPW